MSGGDVYAFIPARRGSKRVARKNLERIAGKPLLAYTVETALASGIFDHVVVNSEDTEILAVAAAHGAETYRRPAALASDTTYIIEIIQEMIRSLALPARTVLGVLFPTCPLRTTEDIRGAFALFEERGCGAPVVSVTSYEYPVQLALDLTADGRLEPLFPVDYRRSTRHNDHKRMYRANFAIIFNTCGVLAGQRNLIGERPWPYVMPPERAIDIDDPFQMDLVRLILESRAAGLRHA
jgi:CMP-N-acetylneuraminic acid synthetase